MGAVVSLRDVRHRRGGRDVLAIDELDLRAGERLAVLGPNGAGKTTLLRLLAGLDAPTAGRVELNGVSVAGADLELRRRVGYATQRPGLLAASVIQNVELPLRWRGWDGPARRSAALAALERLGVAQLADRRAPSLSGGEAQRVSLARALAIEPELLLLDEPAAGLDPEARRAFFDDLEVALAERTATVVHVSHRSDEALRLADRIVVMTAGELRQLGDPASVVKRPADATVAKLLGYDNVVPVQVDDAAQVLIAGAPCGVAAKTGSGEAILAAWGSAVRVVSPNEAPLRATVQRVSQGPGHWELMLDAGQALLARLPLDGACPQAGDLVGVQIEPAQAVVIRNPPGTRAPGARAPERAMPR